MKYSPAKQGRVFIIRLENGEVVHEEIEKFARAHDIRAAALTVIGGAGPGSRLVVGPEDPGARPINPMEHVLEDVREIAGAGTLFPDEDGRPVVHLHMACGRNSNTITGCIRRGVKVWQVMEIILFELTDSTAVRVFNPELGFHLLEP